MTAGTPIQAPKTMTAACKLIPQATKTQKVRDLNQECCG